MGPPANVDRDDMRHFEAVQYSLVKLALSIYTILGAAIFGFYSIALQRGVEEVMQKSGLNLRALASWVFTFGWFIGVALLGSWLFNFARFLVAGRQLGNESYRSWWSILLNIVPALVFFGATVFCWYYSNRLFG